MDNVRALTINGANPWIKNRGKQTAQDVCDLLDTSQQSNMIKSLLKRAVDRAEVIEMVDDPHMDWNIKGELFCEKAANLNEPNAVNGKGQSLLMLGMKPVQPTYTYSHVHLWVDTTFMC